LQNSAEAINDLQQEKPHLNSAVFLFGGINDCGEDKKELFLSILREKFYIYETNRKSRGYLR
jgi:hypothetical protein